MRKSAVPLLSLIIVALAATAVLAQTQPVAPSGPPKVIQILREEVKPGKAMVHEKHETAWTEAFKKASYPDHFLAVTSISGPTEDLFISGYDSYAALEKQSKHIEGMPAITNVMQQYLPPETDYVSTTRNLIATYREDLSYRPAIELGKMRYFRIDTIRVRPGHDQDFEEMRKLINTAHEKLNIDEHWVVYQVASGAPNGTYLVFFPVASLAVADDFSKIHGDAYKEAVGDEGRKKLRELAGSAIMFSESNTYAFSPKMSFVSETVVAADPEFWKPKAVVAKKPAAPAAGPAEKAPKPTTPAGKKEAKKSN